MFVIQLNHSIPDTSGYYLIRGVTLFHGDEVLLMLRQGPRSVSCWTREVSLYVC